MSVSGYTPAENGPREVCRSLKVLGKEVQTKKMASQKS